MAHVQRLVGIDFGTSTSVVRTKRYQNGEPIGDNYSSSGVTFGNGEGDTKAATLVRRNADGGYTCGAEAEEAMLDSTLFREFKMRLESQDPGEQAQARELTAAFFRYLYERYDHQRSDLGEMDDEEQTLVSLPVKWREETRRFMAQVAEAAGFKNIAIMDEATAALYATLCRKMSEINQEGLLRTGESGYLLLVDMGAGTTDLALCRYTVDSRPGEIIRADRIKNEIIATWPEDRNAATFGGREVDLVLEGYVEAYLKDCGLPEAMAAQFVSGSGTSAAKRWKENSVSKLLNEGKRVETCAFIANVAMLLPQQKPFPAFGRPEFEGMLGDRLEQFKGLVTGCLQRASEMEPEILSKGLDLVILTGGHSAWYFTEELLNGTMPGLALPQLERVQREKSRVIRLTNPQETVALGLVYSQLPFQVGKQEPKEEESRPVCDEDKSATSVIQMDVQLNGRTSVRIQVPADADEDAIVAAAMANDGVQKHIAANKLELVKAIVVKGKLVNLIFRNKRPRPDNPKPLDHQPYLTEEQFERVKEFFKNQDPWEIHAVIESDAVVIKYYQAKLASGSIRIDRSAFTNKWAGNKWDIKESPPIEDGGSSIPWRYFLSCEIRIVQASGFWDWFGSSHSCVYLSGGTGGYVLAEAAAEATICSIFDHIGRCMKELQTHMRKFVQP